VLLLWSVQLWHWQNELNGCPPQQGKGIAAISIQLYLSNHSAFDWGDQLLWIK
jgi:hypothetical protein